MDCSWFEVFATVAETVEAILSWSWSESLGFKASNNHCVAWMAEAVREGSSGSTLGGEGRGLRFRRRLWSNRWLSAWSVVWWRDEFRSAQMVVVVESRRKAWLVVIGTVIATFRGANCHLYDAWGSEVRWWGKSYAFFPFRPKWDGEGGRRGGIFWSLFGVLSTLYKWWFSWLFIYLFWELWREIWIEIGEEVCCGNLMHMIEH